MIFEISRLLNDVTDCLDRLPKNIYTNDIVNFVYVPINSIDVNILFQYIKTCCEMAESFLNLKISIK